MNTLRIHRNKISLCFILHINIYEHLYMCVFLLLRISLMLVANSTTTLFESRVHCIVFLVIVWRFFLLLLLFDSSGIKTRTVNRTPASESRERCESLPAAPGLYTFFACGFLIWLPWHCWLPLPLSVSSSSSSRRQIQASGCK